MPTIAIDPSASTPQEREHATKTKTPNMSVRVLSRFAVSTISILAKKLKYCLRLTLFHSVIYNRRGKDTAQTSAVRMHESFQGDTALK